MAFLITAFEMGHLATLHHQRIIKRLIVGLDKLQMDGKISLEPLPETDIDPGNPESKCPDIILRDNEKLLVPVIIEVATNFGTNTDLKKLARLIQETDYGIQEGFVYNFEKGTWSKYELGKGLVDVNPSWSHVLGIDLGELMPSQST